MTGVTGVWYCVQCGYVDGPCETIPSEFTDGPCDAEWQPDEDDEEVQDDPMGFDKVMPVYREGGSSNG